MLASTNKKITEVCQKVSYGVHAAINGNGEDDKIKFTLGQMFIGDGFTNAVIDGAVVDEFVDPPFTIGGLAGAFGGPTTAWDPFFSSKSQFR